MREVTVSTVISAPREEIFDFVCDLAGRPAFTDHFMRDYRLARVNPVGVGAASRFQLRAPFAKEYAELQITEVDRPRRIVEEIRVGRRGRNRSLAVYDFSSEGRDVTRVELTTFSEPATVVDRIRELGAAGWARRQTAKALERLRMIFEEPPRGELKRVTIAGFEPEKAPRFGVPAGMDPAHAPVIPGRPRRSEAS
ncbi:MAG: SRPBCC family protein [Thermoleophilaceae bacterium]|nr:SRPBCC family protein [Thermoleophilaceae bacterium]